MVQKRTGIRWSLFTMLEDLDFADDIALSSLALLSRTRKHLQRKSSRMNDLASTIGVKINTGKTKVMSNDPNKGPIQIDNQALVPPRGIQ